MNVLGSLGYFDFCKEGKGAVSLKFKETIKTSFENKLIFGVDDVFWEIVPYRYHAVGEEVLTDECPRSQFEYLLAVSPEIRMRWRLEEVGRLARCKQGEQEDEVSPDSSYVQWVHGEFEESVVV